MTFDASGEVRIAQGGPAGGPGGSSESERRQPDSERADGRVDRPDRQQRAVPDRHAEPGDDAGRGQLFLGVNDSNFGDNGGNFIVKVTGPAARRR